MAWRRPAAVRVSWPSASNKQAHRFGDVPQVVDHQDPGQFPCSRNAPRRSSARGPRLMLTRICANIVPRRAPPGPRDAMQLASNATPRRVTRVAARSPCGRPAAWNTVPHGPARLPRPPARRAAPPDAGRTRGAGARRRSAAACRSRSSTWACAAASRAARTGCTACCRCCCWAWSSTRLLDIANVDNDTAAKLVNLVFLWPLIAVSAKRQHDFNFSAWWALIHFIPAVGSLILLLVDGSVPGHARRQPLRRRPARGARARQDQ